jgi:ribosomal protein S18 acetylase RimI-like enzyme
MIELRTAASRDRRTVAHVLAVSFAHDPVVRWLLPSGRGDEAMFLALARYSHYVAGCSDIAEIDGRPVGASLWDPPGHKQSTGRYIASGPSLLRAMRHRIRQANALETAFHKNRPEGTFWYLALVGAVEPGKGIGTALLQHRLDTITGPAYLESSNEANIPLYERFGFEVTGEIHLPFNGPTCWTMYRD